jgi:hypothetical protein
MLGNVLSEVPEIVGRGGRVVQGVLPSKLGFAESWMDADENVVDFPDEPVGITCGDTDSFFPGNTLMATSFMTEQKWHYQYGVGRTETWLFPPDGIPRSRSRYIG